MNGRQRHFNLQFVIHSRVIEWYLLIVYRVNQLATSCGNCSRYQPVTMIISRTFVMCVSCVTTLIAIRMRIPKWLKYDGNMHLSDGERFTAAARKADILFPWVPAAGSVELEWLPNDDAVPSDEANCTTTREYNWMKFTWNLFAHRPNPHWEERTMSDKWSF